MCDVFEDVVGFGCDDLVVFEYEYDVYVVEFFDIVVFVEEYDLVVVFCVGFGLW